MAPFRVLEQVAAGAGWRLAGRVLTWVAPGYAIRSIRRACSLPG